MTDTPALLVGHEKLLQTTGGGVQICTREYAAALQHAGFQLHQIAYQFETGLATRILARLSPKKSPTTAPPGLYRNIEVALNDTNARFIFFGLNLYAALSQRLRTAFPDVNQVLLSYGLETVDFVIEERIRRRVGDENRLRAVVERMIGRQLLEEVEQRRWIDAVLTLSPFEAELEKWLGCPKVHWIPGAIIEDALEFSPIDGKVGCVSTLDHPPNFWGAVELFEALEGIVPSHFRFCLVGQPRELGNQLAKRYSFVEYLGPLPDQSLRLEAATWCCFVHPLFEYAKGCSTKIGVSLGWGLPVATTEFGVRGYHWDDRAVSLAKTPVELAALVLGRSTIEHFASHRQAISSIREQTPSLLSIGQSIRSFLLPARIEEGHRLGNESRYVSMTTTRDAVRSGV